MSNIRITKQFSFETGHALYGYDGKCKNVHGHRFFDKNDEDAEYIKTLEEKDGY